MFHEWQHIQQAEIAYRTNPAKLVDAYVEQLKTKNSDFIEQLMKENKYSRVQALKEINSSLHKQLDTLFGKYPKFKAGSDQYKKDSNTLNVLEIIQPKPKNILNS